VASRDGACIRTIDAPEGARQIVLFTYAPGKLFRREEIDCERYGRLAAEIHLASEDFVSSSPRFALDLEHLLERPLRQIEPHLRHRRDDWQYLRGLADRLRDRLAGFHSDALEIGFCHGDLNPANVHVDEQTITSFDFDFCGHGWRACDLAVFRWNTHPTDKPEIFWKAFERGYRERRAIRDADLFAIPLFMAMKEIWLFGLQSGHGPGGFGWLNPRYLEPQLKWLREFEASELFRAALT
jgi:Ser/Thr protein kinase RdoA (MazF antagonist)